MDPAVLTVDCIGLQCPAPILVLTKAANKAIRPALLEVYADDGDFAIDIRAWCRSTGAVLKSLLEVDGRFVARIALEGERTATDRPAQERTAGPPLPEVQPRRIDVDCRSLRSPPVLHLDRIARGTAGPALLVVRSNDHRFPTDLEAWCRSSGAELIHLDGTDSNYVATVGWGGARLPTAPAPEPRVATPNRPPPQVPARPTNRSVALLVVRDDPASLSSALTVAMSSAASGMSVTVYFAHGGVQALRRSPPAAAGSWWPRWFAPPAAAGLSATDSLVRAAELGVRLVACTASLEAQGLVRADLVELSTLEVGTVAAFATDAQGAALSLVF